MNPKRNIFLFTNTFPYGSGETFLTTEIRFLAAEFERINVIPLQADVNLRILPPNVYVTKPLLKFDSKKERTKFILSGILNFSPVSFAFKEWRTQKPFESYEKFWEFVTFLLRFRSALHNLRISPGPDDVLYFYWGHTSVMLAPVLKSKYNCKIAARFHGSDLYEEAKIGYIPFRAYVFPAIDQFITVSEFGRRYLLSKYPQWISEAQVAVSRLGVSNQGVNVQNTDQSGVFHLLSCSNLIELKRIDLIIKALHLIDFRVRWTHFGDGPLKSTLMSLSLELPQNIEVNWMGQCPNSEIMAFYQQNHIDLFINVSSSEGIPVSIMEAMSFGIPAIATDVGGVTELVNETNGVLLPADLDQKLLANTIINFAGNNQQIYRNNAREYWMKYYNAETNYQNLLQLLKHL